MEKSDYAWIYVDFNSYFASVEQQLRPELRGKPVIVVPVESDATSAIAASYEAKALGISTNTPVYEAKRICPEIACVLANHEQYVAFHQRILEAVQQAIPITMVCSIDEVACHLMDNETAPDIATRIAMTIKEKVREQVGEYVRCSVGIAPNRYLAKIATDLKKPDGLTLLPNHEVFERLKNIPLRNLPGIGRNMEQRLLRAGIFTFSNLWEKDAQQLRKIWGSVWGERLWFLLRGHELPEEPTTRSTIGHSHVLAPDLRPPAQARHVARRLILKACSRLRRMGYYANHFSMRLRTEDGLRIEHNASLYRAQDSLSFLHLLEQAWDTFVQQYPYARIKKISVILHGLVAASDLQPELFLPLSEGELKQRERSEKMSRALDKINQKFGRDSVLLGMLPSQGRSFSGTKVAFTRIPEAEEFFE